MIVKSRATTMEEFGQRVGTLFGPESEVKAAVSRLETRSSDVIITPYSKSGTTWLQQMFHQLRTRGDMDFDDISRVVPWLETSGILSVDLNAEQKAIPRGFKSHLRYEQLPQGARIINSVRHPADVAWSLFKFMEGWFIEPGTINPDEFCTATMLKSDDYFDHLLSFWPVRDREGILFLSYEGMLADTRETVRRVAAFCDITLDDSLLELVVERSSIGYMSEHIDRFDDFMLRSYSEEKLLPAGSDSAKVRSGKPREHVAGLSDAFLEQLDAKWQEKIGDPLGFRTYEAMIAEL